MISIEPVVNSSAVSGGWDLSGFRLTFPKTGGSSVVVMGSSKAIATSDFGSVIAIFNLMLRFILKSD